MLIFLDIDGVMVQASPWKKLQILEDGFPAFTKNATLALQQLLIETEGKIVLSTSHKSKYTEKQWVEMFNLRGVSINSISRLPENKNHLSRKDELMNWFNATTISESYLIIDDDKSLNELPSAIKQHLIQPSPYIGLTNELLESIFVL